MSWIGDLLGYKDLLDSLNTLFPRRTKIRFVGGTLTDNTTLGCTDVAIASGAPLGPVVGGGQDGNYTGLTGTTITLTKDTYYATVVLVGTAKIDTDGYELSIVKYDTTQLSAGGGIVCNGNAGTNAAIAAGGSGNSTAGVGGAARTAHTYGGGQAGTNGGTASGGSAGNAGVPPALGDNTAYNGGTGGASGAGGAAAAGGGAGAAAGAAGTAGVFTPVYGTAKYLLAVSAYTGNLAGGLTGADVLVKIQGGQGGTGGSGGGSNIGSSSGAGGGGGGGAGVVKVNIGEVVTSVSTPAGCIRAVGGTAGTTCQPITNGGGGGGAGGGGGGFIHATIGKITGPTVASFFDVSGGNGGNATTGFGTGSAAGANGAGGKSGRVVTVYMNASLSYVFGSVAAIGTAGGVGFETLSTARAAA